MAAAMGAVDEAIKEYLLYRGFVQTLKSFELEKKDEKDKGMRASKIVEYILQCIYRSDFNSLQSVWSQLNRKFFSRLNHESQNSTFKLESSILKFYLTHANRQGRHEEVRAFFEKMSDSLASRRDWKEWFALPFTKSPELHSTFKIYYSKEWQDAFIITLHNFFSTLFTSVPLPSLLNFEVEHQKMLSVQTENRLLHEQLAATKTELASTESKVQKLEARMAQQMSLITAAASKKKPAVATAMAGAALAAGGSRVPPMKKVQGAESSPGTARRPFSMVEPQGDPLSSKSNLDNDWARLRQFSFPSVKSDTTNTKQDISETVKAHITNSEQPPFVAVDQLTYRDHSAPITHCKFAPNATKVATVDVDGVLRVWDPATLETSCKYDSKSSLFSMDWVPQPVDNLILMAGGDAVVRLLDTAMGTCHWEVTADAKFPKILSLVCSPSIFVVSAASQSSSHIPLSPSTAKLLSFGLSSPSLPSSRSASGEMHNMQKKFSEGFVGQLSVWDLKKQQLNTFLPLSSGAVPISCMALNHNSTLLVTGGTDGKIRLFDIVQNQQLLCWDANTREVYNVQFSYDENSVYSMGKEDKFSQWSVMQSGRLLADFPIHQHASQPAVGSEHHFPSPPRGNLFAFESENKYVLTCAPSQALVYKVGQEGQLQKTLTLSGHSGPVTCVDWLQGRRSYSNCITCSIDCSARSVNLLKNSD